jgi:hypothetical protein
MNSNLCLALCLLAALAVGTYFEKRYGFEKANSHKKHDCIAKHSGDRS